MTDIASVFTQIGDVVTGALGILTKLIANPLVAIPILIGVAGVVVSLLRKFLSK